MEMAGEISSRDMQNIAIGSLEIKSAVVTSVADSTNRNQKMMNYELLQIWRNKRPENNREVCIDGRNNLGYKGNISSIWCQFRVLSNYLAKCYLWKKILLYSIFAFSEIGRHLVSSSGKRRSGQQPCCIKDTSH